MAKIINDEVVLTNDEREALKRNLLHPNFENLNLIHKLYGGIDIVITTHDDCSWTASCKDWNFDLTIQN